MLSCGMQQDRKSLSERNNTGMHCRTKQLSIYIYFLCCIVGTYTFALQNTPVGTAASPASRTMPPNVLLIMADDLGFSDLGCYGGEIQTPNLDKLAINGMRFTQFYNTARCWPTRAALLTGYYAQQVKRDQLPGIQRGKRPGWAPLLSARMANLGYRCYHSGKWHLDGMPIQNGFHRSYLLKDQGRFFYPKVHYRDDRKLPAVAKGTDFYATIGIANHAIECLAEHKKQHPEQPFFHYLAFTAPHFPLHALPQDIAKYSDTYRRGWDAVRSARWKKINEMKLIQGKLSDTEPNVGPPYDFPDALEKLGPGEVNRPLSWAALTQQQKKFQSEKMAIHAAMVDRMDQEIGRVVNQLKKMNALENTLILFLSDNGASAEIMVRDDGHDPLAAPGSGDSYLCLGPGWSTVSNTPFRRHKTWVHEGGIRTPLIVHWPAGISASETQCGKQNPTPGHVIDMVPTLLELAGGRLPKAPANSNQPAPPFPGCSLLDAFSGVHSKPTREIWWYHEGNRALRVGKWKIVAAQGNPWSLFDLDTDPTETIDLANQFPAELQSIVKLWKRQEKAILELHRN